MHPLLAIILPLLLTLQQAKTPSTAAELKANYPCAQLLCKPV